MKEEKYTVEKAMDQTLIELCISMFLFIMSNGVSGMNNIFTWLFGLVLLIVFLKFFTLSLVIIDNDIQTRRRRKKRG